MIGGGFMTDVFEEILEYSLTELKRGVHVRLNITKIRFDDGVKYDTLCGVFVDRDLSKVFELVGVTNDEIDEFLSHIDLNVNMRTLFNI